VYRPRRCHVHELPDYTRDPAPDSNSLGIPNLPEFVGPSLAFGLCLVAVVLEHQVSDAPDIDLRDHAVKATVRTSIVGKAQGGKGGENPPFATGHREPISAPCSTLSYPTKKPAL